MDSASLIHPRLGWIWFRTFESYPSYVPGRTCAR
jgi:hypothetical protein